MNRKINKSVVAVLFSDGHLSKETVEQNHSIHRQIATFARDMGLDCVIDLGDDFESRKAQPLDILDGYNQQLYIFNEIGVTKISIPGNHDKVDYESTKSYLDIFRHYPNFKLIREYSCIDLIKEWNILIHLIPYFKEDTVYLNYLTEAIDRVDNSAKGVKHILCTHIAVNGVNNNDGSEVNNTLNQSVFRKFDKVFVGHYHNRSQVGENIFYIGSTAPKNYGEDNQKGICVLYDDLSHEYIPLQFKNYHVVKIDVDSCTAKDFDKIIAKHSDVNGYVRFEFTGTKDKLEALDQNFFKTKGFDVKIKHPDIVEGVKKAEREEFVNYNASSILDEFKNVFCVENNIEDVETGIKYLQEIIKQNGKQ